MFMSRYRQTVAQTDVKGRGMWWGLVGMGDGRDVRGRGRADWVCGRQARRTVNSLALASHFHGTGRSIIIHHHTANKNNNNNNTITTIKNSPRKGIFGEVFTRLETRTFT